MKVRDVMIKDVASVGEDLSVYEVSKLMAEREIGSIVVVREGRPVGIVTERDFLKRVIVAGRDTKTTRIREVASSPVVTVDPDTNIASAILLMEKNKVRRLIAVEDGKLAGIVSSRDFMKYLSHFYELVW